MEFKEPILNVLSVTPVNEGILSGNGPENELPEI